MGTEHEGDLKVEEDGRVWEFLNGVWRLADLVIKLPPLNLRPPGLD